MNDVLEFIQSIEHETRKQDCLTLYHMLNDITGLEARLWHEKMIGYGVYHYVNKTNEGDMFMLGYAPAKAHITLYVAVQGLSQYKPLLDKLGPHKTGKVCLYITNFKRIDLNVLKEILTLAYKDAKNSN